jgi:hypothetical protein
MSYPSNSYPTENYRKIKILRADKEYIIIYPSINVKTGSPYTLSLNLAWVRFEEMKVELYPIAVGAFEQLYLVIVINAVKFPWSSGHEL